MTPRVTIGVSLKMYFGHLEARAWFARVAQVVAGHPAVAAGRVEFFVIPTYLQITAALESFAGTPTVIGAQDAAAEDFGAFTGEVSPAELAEVGVGVVEVGHAERRRLFGETDEIVRAKTAAALRNGLRPVLCIGEGEHVEPAEAATRTVAQLRDALNGAPDGPLIVAYEPVWAIGAAQPAPVAHTQTVTRALREAVTDRPGTFVIYGGSAGPGLLTELGDAVDGLFLGRFAHDPDALEAVLDEAAALAGAEPRMIGLGTYAFFWEHSHLAPAPLSLIGALEATRALNVDLFQICDYAPLESMDAAQLADAAAAARDLHLTIELGTKGIDAQRLARFLELAAIFGAGLVRSMLYGPASRPSLTEAEQLLTAAMPAFEASGVTLALETYEQVATADLVGLIERIGSDHLGVCLDPANVVARLESPRTVVEATARYVKNVHVKDFAFSRREGWVGFTYSGAAMGTGLHDYPHLLETVRPRERGINEIVEHWLPWQGDPGTTITTEREWTRTTLEYLRSTT